MAATAKEKPAGKRDPNDPCLFCTDPQGVSLENDLAYSARDTYPVSPGHTVIVPRRHVASFFALTAEEVEACMDLLRREKARIDAEHGPDGYNVGVNVGKAAGQSIFHVHIHLIPRYTGDVENPQGGVRHVIPRKAHYSRR